MKLTAGYLISLGAVQFSIWLLLSGHYVPFLILAGLGSSAFAVFFARRMELVDPEGVPYVLLTRRIFSYLPWLVVEVVRSNVAVARIILRRELPICPAIIRVRAMQKTDLGTVILANSITLTPGTITVGIRDRLLFVHALDERMATGMDEAQMNVRIAGLEGTAR